MTEINKSEHTDDKKAFVNEIRKLWNKYPDYRFGQLLKHILAEAPIDYYFLGDEDFLKILEGHLRDGFKSVNPK